MTQSPHAFERLDRVEVIPESRDLDDELRALSQETGELEVRAFRPTSSDEHPQVIIVGVVGKTATTGWISSNHFRHVS